jgi:phosphatidylserine/phosphatidylglycerophosphate/cardiolipin synthase-like enzyme
MREPSLRTSSWATSARVKVTVIGSWTPEGDGSVTYDVVQPEGRAQATARWAAEITRQQFLHNVGHAIIHSKVLLVDPFGDHPIVVTGSHNFSKSASSANDENFIVIRDDPAWPRPTPSTSTPPGDTTRIASPNLTPIYTGPTTCVPCWPTSAAKRLSGVSS